MARGPLFITVTDPITGKPVANATATIKVRGTNTVAAVYTTVIETDLTVINPVLSSSNGSIIGWMNPGRYNISLAKSGYTLRAFDFDIIETDNSTLTTDIELEAHRASSTNIHGIANTAFLAPLASPIFTGVPAAPTPVAGDSTTKLATTAFTTAAIATSLNEARRNNLLAWTNPVGAAVNVITSAAGIGYYRRIYLAENTTIGSIGYFVSVAGAGIQLPVNVFFAVYTKGGTRIGVSTAQDAAVQTVGYKTAALTLDAGQSLTQPGGPNEYVWGAILIGTQSTTNVQWRTDQNDAGLLNAGLVATSPFIAGSSGTALTALPASFTPTTALAASTAPWMALL